MKILDEAISPADLAKAQSIFDGPMVKAVVDIKRRLVAVDADLHADLEQLLLQDGSAQDDVWGINLWYEDTGDDFVEFESMINVRPRQGNRSRSVESLDIQQQIIDVVKQWIR